MILCLVDDEILWYKINYRNLSQEQAVETAMGRRQNKAPKLWLKMTLATSKQSTKHFHIKTSRRRRDAPSSRLPFTLISKPFQAILFCIAPSVGTLFDLCTQRSGKVEEEGGMKSMAGCDRESTKVFVVFKLVIYNK